MKRAWLVSVVGMSAGLLGACGSSDASPEKVEIGQDGGAFADANGGSDGAAGSDGSPTNDAGSTTDGAFVTAPHEPFPPLQKHAGKVLATPHVVTITYANDANRQKLEDFGAFIVTSSWLTTVGKDYGVGAGTHTAHRLAENAPTTLTDTAMTAKINALIAANEVPAPAASNNQVLYLFYAPKGTTVNDGTQNLCGSSGYSGYHSSATSAANVDYPYAILPDCTTIDDLTSTSSHEIIEASTDPYADPNEGWYSDVALPNPWWAASPNENGDLCQNEDNVTDSGWTVQRIWSMTAAAAGASPCVPIPAGDVYFNVTASPATVQKVAPGESATFTLTGWSNSPVSWKVVLDKADQTDFDPLPTLDANAMTNGGTVKVTLKAPASGQASGKVGAAYVWSGNYLRFWPVAIQIK